MPLTANPSIAIVGLGYVGLPLAVEFGKQYQTIGFDISAARVEQLQAGKDLTLEITQAELTSAKHLQFTNTLQHLAHSDIYIITVPTPIDRHHRPNLEPLIKASEMISSVIKPGNIVIYESTVYPGCTEEVCIPIIEKGSALTYNHDFYAGYSPERINPGDKEHRVHSITKVTSGSTPEIADYIDALYATIVTAGTYRASSIRVAEAAKVIENTQRDINIALINELAIIFSRLNIDTEEVLQAAGSKWNFLPFRPGLVGGHCIGVDPYYLTHKAQEIGYHPEVILSGRRINDNMGIFVAESVIKLMTKKKIHVVGSHILIMGLSFKENCPDIRNTKTIDIIRELKNYHCDIEVYDPWVDTDDAQNTYGISMTERLQPNAYDAIILCVGHRQFKEMGIDNIKALGKHQSVLYDVKYILPKESVDGRI